MTDWVRLWHDMPTDPKWRVIARKSGQPLPCVIALFTLMLTTASSSDERGNIASLTNEDAAAALDMDEEDVDAIRSAMEGRVLSGDRLSGWERRQPKRERENDNSSERVRRHRAETQKADEQEQRHETPRNATERLEKRREDKNKNPPTPRKRGNGQSDLAEKPEGVSDQTWHDFQKLRDRKRAPLTPTALDGIIREAGEAGWPLQDALAECVTRGWQAFKADWVEKRQVAKPIDMQALADNAESAARKYRELGRHADADEAESRAKRLRSTGPPRSIGTVLAGIQVGPA